MLKSHPENRFVHRDHNTQSCARAQLDLTTRPADNGGGGNARPVTYLEKNIWQMFSAMLDTFVLPCSYIGALSIFPIGQQIV